MDNNRQRQIRKLLLWSFGIAAIAVASILGANAIDEELSAESKALMAKPQPPAPSERNGYMDLLGIGTPGSEKVDAVALRVLDALKAEDKPGFKPTPEWKTAYESGSASLHKDADLSRLRCRPEQHSCLESAAGKKAELAQLLAKHATPLERYRTMRSKPEFAETYYPTRWDSGQPPVVSTLLHKLAMLSIAAKAINGDMEGSVRELELEDAFYRRMAASATLMSTKMSAITFMQQNALLVSDLLRTDATAVAPFLPRLEALMQPLSATEADMAKVLRMDAALWVTWLQQGDAVVPLFTDSSRQWWHTLAPFFYRPRETANLYAAQSALWRKAAEAPAPQYFDAMAEAMRQAQALVPHGPANHLVNPVGRGALDVFSAGDVFSIMPYAARVHDTQGLYALVALQLKLRAAGAATPEAIAAALAGPLGTSHPDPYTGKPMVYDPKTNSLGFESKNKSGVVQEIRKRFGGRVATAL